MLKRSVGRRALEWLYRLWPAEPGPDPLDRRKLVYADSQLNELKRAAEEQEKKLGGTLYPRKIVDDVEPWSKLGPINCN